jgi:hypothetical protein
MDYTDHIPKSITTAWIKKHRRVFNIIEMYMSTLVDRLEQTGGGGTYSKVVRQFPYGHRLLFLHWRFWTDVDNGGFEQFLGNTSAIDKSGQVIVDTVDALRCLGLDDFAEWLKEAIAILAAELPPVVLKALSPAKRPRRRVKHPISVRSDEEIQERLWVLDRKFNALKYSWFPKLDKYIRQHAEDFVHSGWKSQS